MYYLLVWTSSHRPPHLSTFVDAVTSAPLAFRRSPLTPPGYAHSHYHEVTTPAELDAFAATPDSSALVPLALAQDYLDLGLVEPLLLDDEEVTPSSIVRPLPTPSRAS